MGQGSSSQKAPEQPGPPRKRKSVIEKVAGKVKKFTTRKKKNRGEEPVKNLLDAAKYTLKPGGQFGEVETDLKGNYMTHDPDERSNVA